MLELMKVIPVYSYSSPSNEQVSFCQQCRSLQALKPIADDIGLLESPYTTIASIYLTMIQLYNLYTGVKGNKFVNHVKTCLTKCFKQYFCHSIFPISIFLWPQYWDFSLSKDYSANWMKKEVIQLAILWNFTKSKCIAINQSLQMYIATKENDFMLGLDPISLWKTTSKFNSALRDLATIIFKINGHAAPVQTLFSGMSYKKSKTCNCMNVENLKMFTRIRNDLARSIPDSEKSKNTKEIWQTQLVFNFDSLCGECRWCWREHFKWSWKRVWWNVIGLRWQRRTWWSQWWSSILIENYLIWLSWRNQKVIML